MNLNKVMLAGRLTRDPEVKYTSKGTAICKLGLASTRTWKNEAGEKKEETVFVDVDCFGKQAETVAQYFRKGRAIFVEGRLKLDQWDDKQTGQKRSKLGIMMESFQFVGDKPKDEAPAKLAAPASEPTQVPDDKDDVPF